MAHEKIRLGIIGANIHYGWGTRAHLPALTHLPDYELVAVCTAHPETAQEAAQAYQELPIPERLSAIPAGVRAGEPQNVASMYQGFAAAIRAGKRVEPDCATAVIRHQLIEAVQTASDQGERVTLQVA